MHSLLLHWCTLTLPRTLLLVDINQTAIKDDGTPAEVLTGHPANNVTENIFGKIGTNLHQRPDHPICIIKEAIYSVFDERFGGKFTKLDDLHPVVSARAVPPVQSPAPFLSLCMAPVEHCTVKDGRQCQIYWRRPLACTVPLTSTLQLWSICLNVCCSCLLPYLFGFLYVPVWAGERCT